jgi:hypothetical protein
MRLQNRKIRRSGLLIFSHVELIPLNYFFIGCLLIFLDGCKKFVEIDPPVTSISSVTVFSSNSSAASAMTGIYDEMESNSSGISDGTSSLSFLGGLLADELTNYSTNQSDLQFYTNSLTSSNGGSSNDYFWNELYNEIYAANAVIEGLNGSDGVTPALKQQLTSEAKFMRAFLYFYAVNLYGDVPLATTTNYQVNNTLSRTSSVSVYQQIVRDLKDAQSGLSNNYLDPSGNVTNKRIRPNQGAATALLARTYLYTGQWDSAEIQATAVIVNPGHYSLDTLKGVFIGNSTEAIWQLYPVSPGYNTYDAYYFILTSAPGTGQFTVALSNNLINVFEPGDMRWSDWVGTFQSNGKTYYYPYKYKVGVDNPSVAVTEYNMVLRLGEQYLIRAEARAEQGDIQGAQADLDTIRARAGLPNTTANDQPSLLAAIQHERQVELFTEWGHRWLDLKRTGTVNAVMGAPGNVCSSKGGVWNSDWALVPLPLSEIQINPNLTQNAGY